MAKTTYIDLLPSLEKSYFSGVKSSDRFVFSRIVKKSSFTSVKKKRGLTNRSLLPQIAEDWSLLSDAQKNAWSSAGAECNLNGYRLFVQDQALRIKNELSGTATPSDLHQSLVGALHIESPGTELKIIQIHPHYYWVSKKVSGRKGVYEPVLINEDLAFPFKLSLNYSSDLTAQSGNAFARLYARFWHSYQGADQYTDLEIDLDFFSVWKSDEIELTTLVGYVIRYDLYFHLYDLRGDLYIDNIKVEHSAQNWARDPYCKDINQGFTRAFYQIPKHWTGVVVPSGAEFESIYKDF